MVRRVGGGLRFRIALALSAAAAALVFAALALAAPADLDTSFGSGGKQLVDFGGGYDRATHVAMTPDGRIVAVGTTATAGGGVPGKYAITRLTAAGALDSSFGTGGEVALPSPSNAIGGGVVVLPNEQIVVSGQGNTPGDFVTERLNSNGTLDTSFGTNGISTVDFGGTDGDNAMVAQPDGKLVLVGTTSTGGGDFAIARLNANGTLDTSFNGTGKRTINFGGSPDVAFAVAIQPDGKIVVAGAAEGTGDMVVTRLNADGTNDTSFAPPGDQASIGFGGSNDSANAMALQPDGKIVVVGSTDAGGPGGSAIARLNANGTLDTSFGTAGKLTPNFGGTAEAAVGVVVQQNGKIAVLSNAGAHNDFVLARYNPDGTVDTGFGTGGAVAVDFGGFEFDGDLALQPDGKLVLAGSTDVHTNYDMAIARLNGDPVQTTTTTTTTTSTTTTAQSTTTSGAPPPPPPTIQVSTSTAPGGRGGVILNTRLGGCASVISLDLNGDGRPDFSVPAKLPFINILLPQTIRRAITVTGFGPSCGTATTTVNPTIPGSGLPGTRVPPIVIFAASSSLFQDTVPNCTQASVIEGLIDARGCFAHFSAVNDVPAAERATAQRYYGAIALPGWLAKLQPCSGKLAAACEDLTKAYTKEYSVYVSGRTVNLNGLTITPAGGHSMVVDPNALRVFSSSATVKLGSIVLKSGNVDLDFSNLVHITGHLANPDLYNGITKPVLTFDPRRGLPLIGGFPLDAGAELAFAADGGVRESKITLHVKLPAIFDVFGSGDQPSAAGAGVISNDQPFHVDTLDLRVPHASLGGIGFDNVAFHYARAGDPDPAIRCPRDYWHATANITLGNGPNGEPGAGFVLSPPPSQNGIAFCAGGFKSAGGQINFGFPIPPPQLFPGVLLNDINFGIGLNPTVLRGGATISAVDLFRISGTLLAAFAHPWQPYTLTRADAGAELQDIAPRTFTSTTFAIGGSVALTVPAIGSLNIAHGAGMYSYPDYVAANAHVDTQLGIFIFHGSLAAQLSVRTRHFEAAVDAHVCLRGVKIACAGGLVIVSSRGVVACLNIGPLHPGVGLGTNLRYEVWLIDGCKPSHYWVQDVNRSRDAAAAAAAGLSFKVAPGETTKNIQLTGAGGAPKVLITGPGGVSVSLDQDGLTRSGALVGLRADQFGATYIGLDHARPGTYTVTPLPGSVALGKLSATRPGYDTNFTGRVTGHGGRLALHYDARKRGGGQRLTFYESGTNVMHEIGSATGGRGVLHFTPAAGRRGTRTIVVRATVDGSPIADQTIARFKYAGASRAGTPRRVTVRRRGTALLVSWAPVSGALRYGVVVNRSGGSQQRIVVSSRRSSLRIKDYPLTEGGVVGVSAQGPLGDWGTSRHSASLKAVKPTPSIFLSPLRQRR